MQNPHAVFRGIWIPLVTPFLDGAVDLPALRRLVRFYKTAKVHGLVACGTTAEAAALDDDEQRAVLDAVLDEAGDLPVAMGLAGNNQRRMLARLAELASHPVAGFLASAPSYIRPSQDGVRDWFHALADAAARPLVLYDIPYRTGVQIELPTLMALAAHPNIAAVKDCGGSVEKTMALIQDGRLAVMAGEDLQAFNTLCLGGSGAIAASAHVRPDLYVALYDAIAAGSLEQARTLFRALAGVIRLLYAQPNPGPLKAVLAPLHGFSESLRAPMMAAPADLREALAAAVAGLPHGG